MNKDTFIVSIETEHIYSDIAKGVETGFDNWNYELNRPLPEEKNENVIELTKDELRGKIMTEFLAQRLKTYIQPIKKTMKIKKQMIQKKLVVKKTYIWRLSAMFGSNSTWK